MSVTTPQARWRPLPLLTTHLLAGLLLFSWLWPTSRPLWDALDQATFHLLNGSLGSVPLWDWLWALASVRVFDILVGALLLTLLIRRDWLFAQHQLRPALFTFVGLLLVLLVIRVLVTKLAGHFGWQHASPSVEIAGAYHLSDHFPLLERVFELKDRSSRSFPGDHASVLLIWGLFMALFARGGRLAVVVTATLLFMLPRLVAGAHWFSDDFVGGLLIALLAIGWGYCTPLGAHIAAVLLWLARAPMQMAGRLPLLRQLAVLRD
ncbi:phosphatase PAP2 family protein [Pseudomonas lopnurensis]|uniref:phosphatase PAP2 family protein n=1 Tax=Pseudomonas lopnurensis TaxID=1477517 RepID=UPI00187A68AF|nr:phosphatase PAP2 family protein [Pseudomonas lopnurensis]MBE7376244.1 phosphatase PAP2 family protein [Pseudomonas lopnurensis]